MDFKSNKVRNADLFFCAVFVNPKSLCHNFIAGHLSAEWLITVSSLYKRKQPFERVSKLVILNLIFYCSSTTADLHYTPCQWAFCNKRSHGTKSAMLEGKLIIIPAMGH